MKINKAFKFRIYPNQEQQKLINQTFGCVRFVYNHFLNQRNELYKTEQKSTTYVNQAKKLTLLKQELTWQPNEKISQSIDLDEILIKLKNKITIKEISKQVNVSYETIRKILKSCNVKWRRNYVSDFTNEQISSIINKFDAGEAIEKIAKWYEISPPAISRLLRAN